MQVSLQSLVLYSSIMLLYLHYYSTTRWDLLVCVVQSSVRHTVGAYVQTGTVISEVGASGSCVLTPQKDKIWEEQINCLHVVTTADTCL